MPLFNVTITQTATLEIAADDLEAAIQAAEDKRKDGIVEFDTEFDGLSVKFADKTLAQWERALDDVAGISVYESQDNPGQFGFTGCESDDYESRSDAIIAAAAFAGLFHEETSNVPEKMEAADAPTYLTDGEGQWNLDPHPLRDRLESMYSEAEDWPGARLLSTTYQSHYLAMVRGRLGILTEVEMDFASKEHYDGISSGSSGVDVVSKEVFQIRLEQWKKRLEAIAARFPFSEVFVAYGDPTLDARLCLCAFTPVELNEETLDITPPYRDERRLAELDAAINDLVM